MQFKFAFIGFRVLMKYFITVELLYWILFSFVFVEKLKVRLLMNCSQTSGGSGGKGGGGGGGALEEGFKKLC